MSNLRGDIALGEEFVPAGEAAAIIQIVTIHQFLQEFIDRKRTPVPRDSTQNSTVASGRISSSSRISPKLCGRACSASRAPTAP